MINSFYLAIPFYFTTFVSPNTKFRPLINYLHMNFLKFKIKTVVATLILLLFCSSSYSQNDIASDIGDVQMDLISEEENLPSWAQTAINATSFEDNNNVESNNVTNCIAQSIIDYSKQFMGTPYRRGSKGPKAFDCSGFTSFVFKNFGYKLGASCVVQINEGTKIGKEELIPGDLVFFKGRNIKSDRAGHVGIVVSNDGNGNISFIHASIKGVKINNMNASDYYKQRYITGLRVLENNG